jgi:hypothetical protein
MTPRAAKLSQTEHQGDIMRTQKNTRLGILATAGVGVAGLAIAGFALPATADTTSTDVDASSTSTDLTSSLGDFQAWVSEVISLNNNEVSPVTGVSPDTSVGDISIVEGPLVGDVLSGNKAPIASGNDVSAPVGSGNDVSAPIEAPIEAPIGSGNDTSVDAPVGNGNSADTSTGDLNTDISNDVTDVVDGVTGGIGATVDDVTGSLGLGGLLR